MCTIEVVERTGAYALKIFSFNEYISKVNVVSNLKNWSER